jgi:hypothetical protein
MDANEGKGGSYTRQKDGSLKLIARTEAAAAQAAPAPIETVSAKGLISKKENGNG